MSAVKKGVRSLEQGQESLEEHDSTMTLPAVSVRTKNKTQSNRIEYVPDVVSAGSRKDSLEAIVGECKTSLHAENTDSRDNKIRKAAMLAYQRNLH